MTRSCRNEVDNQRSKQPTKQTTTTTTGVPSNEQQQQQVHCQQVQRGMILLLGGDVTVLLSYV
jgi:hypothetical protein